jgi:DNA-binding IclR family transcriptional regulator
MKLTALICMQFAKRPKVSDPSGHTPRSAARLTTILDELARASVHGLRLTDIVEATGLGKTTAHRLLNGLADQGLIDFDEDSGRFFMGMKMLAWAAAARNRFNIARMAEPALASITRETEDTAYLIGRSGDFAVCLDCWEGTFPIKVLTLRIGDRRPLGIGAGSLALLAALPDADVTRILAQQAGNRSQYTFSDERLREMVAETRRNGYAYNDTHVLKDMAGVTGMAAIAVAVRRADGAPVAALHTTSITARLAQPRRDEIARMLKTESRKLESHLQPVFETRSLQSRSPVTGRFN